MYVKTALLNKELKANAALFETLAHPARLIILKYMAESKICVAGDESGKIPINRITINQHLKKLKKAGLIQEIVSGTKVNYYLNPEKIKTLVREANRFFAKIDID